MSNPKEIKPSAPKGAKASKVTINGQEYTLSYGIRAHWFLEKEYNISFVKLQELIDSGKDPLVLCVYMLHALLNKEHPKLTLEDVLDLADSSTFKELEDMILQVLNGK